MAAGLVTVNFLDGGGVSRTGRFWSSDGAITGLLYPAPVLVDGSGNVIDFTAASPVTQSGTWTVQPGNTANTTAWKVDGSAVSQPVIGSTANDAALSTNPVAVGGLAKTTNPTSVTDGDAVYLRLDKSGRLVAVLQQARDLMTRSAVVTIAASTAETDLIAAGGANVFLDMTSIKLLNTSATALRVDVRDAAAGTVIDTWYVPAGQTVGMVYSTPLKQTTANNKWTLQCSASVTDVRAVAQFAQNL